MNEVLPPHLTAEPLVRRRRKRKPKTPWGRAWRRVRHFVRKHKALSVLLGIVLALLLVLLLWLWWLLHNVNRVPGFEFDLGDDRPAYYGGQNILLVGLDCDEAAPEADRLRTCNDKDGKIDLSNLDGQKSTGNRSDVLMVLHVAEDGQQAQVVSIPRDSYVDVPGHGRNKINAAFSLGGPSLLGQTVEKATGIHLTHMAVVDFNGFRDMTEAIGGVQVYIPADVTAQGMTLWHEGWTTLQGEEALAYVRTRYGLPRGDFDRVQRHQNFLRAVMNRLQDSSVAFNPIKMTNLVEATTEHIALDEAFTTGEMIKLGRAGLQLGSDGISFATVPNDGSATIDGQSVVVLKEKETRALFDAIAHDKFLSYVGDHPVETLPAENQVK